MNKAFFDLIKDVDQNHGFCLFSGAVSTIMGMSLKRLSE
jgi:hypothetical protein